MSIMGLKRSTQSEIYDPYMILINSNSLSNIWPLNDIDLENYILLGVVIISALVSWQLNNLKLDQYFNIKQSYMWAKKFQVILDSE